MASDLLNLVCPAYAGMIPYVLKKLDKEESLSRVCGDDPRI